MKHRPLLLACLLAPALFAGQVYQWKDANGNIVFSDQPPPGQKAQTKDVKGNVVETSGGGYTLREAARKAPVILWANNCGESCDNARNLLRKRGVPYALRNPQASQADFDALKALAGDAIVPLLQVGSSVVRGFEESSYQAALDQAGYPKTADPTLKPQPASKP